MANLLKEYGMEEFSSRVMGCSIIYGGHPTITKKVTNHPDTGILTILGTQLLGTPEKFTREPVYIPVDYFTGMNSLQYPQLGYRVAAAGQYLAYMSRIPTAVRKGLHVSQLKVDVNRLSSALEYYTGFEMGYYDSAEVMALLALKPQLTSWQEGLKKVKAGEIISFVVDENFACVPSPDELKFMSILYRDRVIGHMDANGNIDIQAKQAKVAWLQVTEGRFGVGH